MSSATGPCTATSSSSSPWTRISGERPRSGRAPGPRCALRAAGRAELPASPGHLPGSARPGPARHRRRCEHGGRAGPRARGCRDRAPPCSGTPPCPLRSAPGPPGAAAVPRARGGAAGTGGRSCHRARGGRAAPGQGGRARGERRGVPGKSGGNRGRRCHRRCHRSERCHILGVGRVTGGPG